MHSDASLYKLFTIHVSIEIEALKAELAEALDHSHWVQEKLQEAETQKTEAQATKRTAERVLQMKKTSIRSEVFRLKGNCLPCYPFPTLFTNFVLAELETLEDLHMLRITKVSAHLFEYVYASIFLVSIPCVDFCPIMSKVRITRFGKGHTRYKDEFPKLSTFFLACANYVINEGDDMSVREVRIPLAYRFFRNCNELADCEPSQRFLVRLHTTSFSIGSSQNQIPRRHSRIDTIRR